MCAIPSMVGHQSILHTRQITIQGITTETYRVSLVIVTIMRISIIHPQTWRPIAQVVMKMITTLESIVGQFHKIEIALAQDVIALEIVVGRLLTYCYMAS